jgi:hypothetical protein
VPSPQSEKSYTATPAKPEEGRTAADAKGATRSSGKGRREKGDSNPPGSEIPPEPGVPPTERK